MLMLVSDFILRTNLAVTLANGQIRPDNAQYSLVHPMMTQHGRFPTDFSKPKTVEAFRLMEGSFLTFFWGISHSP